ncbi:hypothetical protein MINTMi198_17940 [Mycobacterium intracellulare M.i.198]|uniref:hypothetical protein n=1 Tax=Mycobacterium intracellulare TaxID=1767 RepID=UPI00031EB7B8|nr:hypothetical protein [Mycobacterium intracellulare]BCP36424.1 hypothetical protein MINTMi198_17940 [Mycobacterium intracellulare M.i.198]
MDDLEFFDVLYQGWSKTTGAENTYWQPIEHDHLPTDSRHRFSVDAVGEDHAVRVAAGLTEEDAAWITALHGCFADLTRRLHQAVDEAERFDIEKDRVISELALAEIENNDLREQLEGYRQRYG